MWYVRGLCGLGYREEQQLQETLAPLWLRIDKAEEDLRRVHDEMASSSERLKNDSDQLR